MSIELTRLTADLDLTFTLEHVPAAAARTILLSDGDHDHIPAAPAYFRALTHDRNGEIFTYGIGGTHDAAIDDLLARLREVRDYHNDPANAPF